ncbi:carboxylesterase 1E-like [Dermacentor albipictus]|uniref:carboxylesterase 1E-like n=1 Tax=Dermacentor albipictus TaxID=60249 RepID=UPI0038FC6648
MPVSESTQRIVPVGVDRAIFPEAEAVAMSIWLSSDAESSRRVLHALHSKSHSWRSLMRSASWMWFAMFLFLFTTTLLAMFAWKRLSNGTANNEENPNDADSNSAFLVSVLNESQLQALSTIFPSGISARKRRPTSSSAPKGINVSDDTYERLPKSHWTETAPAPRDENTSSSDSISTSRRIFSSYFITTTSPDGVSLNSDPTTCADQEPLVRIAVNKAEAVSATRSRDVVFVNTTKGAVIGRKRKIHGTDVAAFLGIPYAANTGGSNRFSAPQPADGWDVALDASKVRAPCYRLPEPRLDEHSRSAERGDGSSHAPPLPSEDCLHVNVWAPMCNNSYCTGLTVLVFIHGGGLRAGGNADRLHEGAVLAAQGQVVVVVPNYRLGVLGFPSRDIVGAARNPGLLDLAMALGWVRESIAAFGGSAENVVLFGSGWGSYLAGLFLVSPKLRSYFATFRIILGSGSPLLKSSHEQQTEEHWNGFLGAAGCADTDQSATLECLRNATAASLAVAQDQFPGAVGVLFPDDFVLPEQPAEFVAEVRTYSPAEVLLTNVVSEGRAEYQRLLENKSGAIDFSVENLMSVVGLSASQLAYHNHVELQAAVSNLYKEHGTGRGSVGAEFLGDVRYNCPSVLFAKRLCRGRARVVHLLIAEPAAAGHMRNATHGDDVPLVFGAPIASVVREGTASSAAGGDVAYSRRVISIWTDFARKGFQALSAEFPAFCDPETNGTSSVLFHDRVIRTRGWKQRQCDFLNRHMMYHATRTLGPLASLQRHRDRE